MELSIEEKAKAYDEALVRANEMIKDMTNIGGVAKVDDIQYIFPELKDSADERIRKELLDFCKNRAEKYFNDPKYKNISAWIAWLEKQGEKPAEWSENDNLKLKVFIGIVNGLDNFSPETKQDLLNWIKSLKERVSPQPKQEWSTNDVFVIKILNTVCDEYLKISTYKGTEFRHEIIDAKNWLNTLKEKSIPQSHWKPSDEQITWLYRAADDASKGSRMKQILNELLSDLKKLREE